MADEVQVSKEKVTALRDALASVMQGVNVAAISMQAPAQRAAPVIICVSGCGGGGGGGGGGPVTV